MANKGMILYAFVIMSNHLHLIMAAKENSKGLSALIRDFKSYTSKQLTAWILSDKKERRRDWMLYIFRHFAQTSDNVDLFQIWTHYNQPSPIRDPKAFNRILNYIHQNPVKAGIVKHAADYRYSSASNYAGLDDNILDVIVAEQILFE